MRLRDAIRALVEFHDGADLGPGDEEAVEAVRSALENAGDGEVALVPSSE